MLKLYLRLNVEIHLMAIYCMAAEHGGLIKKKKVRWIKLKAFPTNVWRPKMMHRYDFLIRKFLV